MLPKILIVDDEAENLRALERTLRGKYDLTAVLEPALALKAIEETDFDAVISDQRMPSMLGTELLAKIAKLRPLTTRVILTGYTETKEILDAINRAEIFRYITKPWDNQEFLIVIQQAIEHRRLMKQNVDLIKELQLKEQELLQLNKNLETMVEKRTAELRALNEKLEELALTDPLTKILNRRGFFNRLTEELERANRYKRPITLAMIDVDQFKFFNDTEGHVFGDEALRRIAMIISTNLRKVDVAGRYGGEEFIVMFPETRIQQGREISERLRSLVENTQFQGQNQGAYLTISIGLSVFPDHGTSLEELVKIADHALYLAKESGRNKVVIA